MLNHVGPEGGDRSELLAAIRPCWMDRPGRKRQNAFPNSQAPPGSAPAMLSVFSFSLESELVPNLLLEVILFGHNLDSRPRG